MLTNGLPRAVLWLSWVDEQGSIVYAAHFDETLFELSRARSLYLTLLILQLYPSYRVVDHTPDTPRFALEGTSRVGDVTRLASPVTLS